MASAPIRPERIHRLRNRFLTEREDMGQRQWLVITEDGRHVTLGRATDPSPQELEKISNELAAASTSGWLAVTEGSYYGKEQLTVLEVRPLWSTPTALWSTALAGFLKARAIAVGSEE